MAGAASAPTPPAWTSGAHEVPLDERTARLDATGAVVGRLVDEAAYVDKGMLVAHFDGGSGVSPMIRIAQTAFAFQSLTLTASVPAAGDSLRVGIAGKVAIRELFSRIGSFTNAQAGGAAICLDNATYPQVKAYFCGFTVPADTAPACSPATDPAKDDFTSPALPPLAEDGGAGGNCVAPGTLNNERGLGGYCTKGGAECPTRVSICGADFGAPTGSYFCTTLCETPGAPCGAGVTCVKDARGTACVPVACIDAR